MLSAAGRGIAMGNADEAVKTLAKRSVSSNDSDAVTVAIDAVLAETGDDRGIARASGQGSRA